MNEEYGTANVDPEHISLTVWMLVNHPQWLSHIKPKFKNSNYDNALEIHEWLDMHFTEEVSRKLQRKLERDCMDEETFVNRHMLIFNNWPTEVKDAVCRAMLHESHGTSLEKPRMILTP